MTTVLSTQYNNIAIAISAYADAARADNARLLSTAMVAGDARITDSGESYTGTLRWLDYTPNTTGLQKPGVGSVDDEGVNLLTVKNQEEVYVKNVDAIAAQESSMQRVISKQDGISYLGRQFGNNRAMREDTNLRSVVSGIISAVYGDTDNVTADTGDGKIGQFGWRTAYTHSTTSFQPLFQLSAASSNPLQARSSFFDVLLDALQGVNGEFEEPFYYLVVTSGQYNVLRKENVFDNDRVQDGNITFSTLLGGKIRLVVSDTALDHGTVGAGDNQVQTGLHIATLMKPGALAYQNVAVPNPTAIDSNALGHNGGGVVTIVSRWGNIIHPKGYSWAATATTDYPTNTLLGTSTAWSKSAQNVNQTGIFPIFHGGYSDS